MILKCPVKKTVWGPLNSQKDLEYAIAKSGQPFGVDQSGPACNVVPTAPCNITYYQYLGFGLHQGIDIPVTTGTEVYAATDGKVTRVSDNVTSGIGVVIWDSTQNIETVYWHLMSHIVLPGDTVIAGQQIAISDNTGYSEGPHLHFQVNNTNEHGMSLGAVDPLHSFVWDDDMRFVQVDGQKDIWLVSKDTKRSLIYNYLAFSLVDGDMTKVEKLSQAQLDAIPDSGKVLAGLDQE